MSEPRASVLGAAMGMLVAVASLASSPLAAQDAGTEPSVPVDLGLIAAASRGSSLPPGWEFRAVGEAPPSFVRVVAAEPGSHLVFEAANGRAGQYWRALDPPLGAGGGTLRWRWRVDDAIPEADLLDPERDDAPARLFVVFGDGGLFSPPRILFYSWAGTGPAPDPHISHVDDHLAVVALRDAASDPLGVWLDETRDPAVDYRTAFGEAPNDPITAVGFMLDTDQTGDRAKAALARIEWLPHRRRPAPPKHRATLPRLRPPNERFPPRPSAEARLPRPGALCAPQPGRSAAASITPRGAV